jgi:hypothetical protein
MNQDQLKRLEPYAKIWDAYKLNGTAVLSHEDKKILESVYKETNNVPGVTLYCPECVREMFESLMKKYVIAKEAQSKRPAEQIPQGVIEKANAVTTNKRGRRPRV